MEGAFGIGCTRQQFAFPILSQIVMLCPLVLVQFLMNDHLDRPVVELCNEFQAAAITHKLISDKRCVSSPEARLVYGGSANHSRSTSWWPIARCWVRSQGPEQATEHRGISFAGQS